MVGLGLIGLCWFDLAGLRHLWCLDFWIDTKKIFFLSLGLDSAKPLHWCGCRTRGSQADLHIPHDTISWPGHPWKMKPVSAAGAPQQWCDAAVRTRGSWCPRQASFSFPGTSTTASGTLLLMLLIYFFSLASLYSPHFETLDRLSSNASDKLKEYLNWALII